MKNLTEKIEEISNKEQEKFNNDSKYNEFNNFLKEMKSKGLVVLNTYTLHPLDTIDKRLYQTK